MPSLPFLLLPLLAAVPRPLEAEPAGPNVLVLMLDDFGWEDAGSLPLPTIQGLAPYGRVYTRFHASSTSSPSRYQLHFGRYPHRAFIGDELDPVTGRGAPTTDLSLAERLTAAGYRTAHFGGWQANGAALPMRTQAAARIHGYERWRAGSIDGLEATGQSHYGWFRMEDGSGSNDGTYTTRAVGEALAGWWQETEGPRFAVASFLAPHAPYELPPADLVASPLPDAPTPREAYALALEAVDTQLGLLLGAIDLTNTWILLLGDNGTPDDVPPPSGLAAGYAPSLFQGGIRTPLIVWGPSVTPGVDEHLVQLVDLPATVLELLGVGSKLGFEDSISFAPTLGGGPGARAFAFSQRFAPSDPDAAALTLDEWAVVRADGWKLLGDASGTRLYDLTTDSSETAPIDAPAIEAALLALRAEALGPDWPH